MKTYKHLALVLVLLLLLSLFGCGSQKNSSKEIHTVPDGKTDLYESAEQLMAEASVIVRVEKTDEEENILRNWGIRERIHLIHELCR